VTFGRLNKERRIEREDSITETEIGQLLMLIEFETAANDQLEVQSLAHTRSARC
jgi:hypothetical protein